jgi:hypothetical protein
MLPRTLFLSRLLGLFYLLCGLAMMAHRNFATGALATLPSDRVMMLAVSTCIAFAGLAMVLAHNVWSKPPAAFLVTLLGWLTLIKGVVYLLIPALWLTEWVQTALGCSAYWYAATLCMLVLGAYLTYAGFKSKPA